MSVEFTGEARWQDQPSPRPWSRLWITLAVVAASFLVLGTLLFGVVQSARNAARKATTNCKLKQFGLALQNYHAQYKSFPPAYIADEDGKPMHSWRVLLLPSFEVEEMTKVYEQYKFDEPWDSPHNSRLASQIDIYHCPNSDEQATITNYLAVVGPQTAWPGAKAVGIPDFADGTANTITVIEVARSNINWMDPRDLSVSDATELITDTLPDGVRNSFKDGAICLFADGSVHFLRHSMNVVKRAGLLTIAGGEVAPIDE